MAKKTKKLTSVLMILFVLLFALMPAYAQFSDTSGNWAKAEIDKWSAKGIILGTDGKFRPDDSITRAEFAAIIGRVFGYIDKSQETFSDVPANAWYADAVAKYKLSS